MTSSAEAIEFLTESQCRDLLESRTIGRIAFAIGDQTEIFPITYATDGLIVIFRTDPGTKLDQVTHARVAFEIDDWDPVGKVGWSVVLKGIAQDVTEGSNPFAATLRARAVWPHAPGHHNHWIAIYPAQITGRRFHRA
jgi:nitroimidazol reductase NimA-like FMN-containing flavoprotein (pyridoxamine 5'-phosphate oxidase superfamily)